MKRYIFKTCVFGLGLLTLASCDDPMDEITSIVYDRVFSPVDFETSSPGTDKVTLKWVESQGAGNYTVELFANDSLEFAGDPTQTFTGITGNSLTIEGLDFDTRYSARIMAIDTADVDRNSKWSEVTFRTNAEQYLESLAEQDVADRHVTVAWPEHTDQPVATVAVEDESGNVVVTKQLTAEEIAAGEAVVEGLQPETKYDVYLYLEDGRQCGHQTFTTIMDLEGAITIGPDDDIAAMLEAASDGAVFALYSGVHAIGGDPLNAGCATITKSITIKGIYPTNRPVICGRFQIEEGASLSLSQVVLDGSNNETTDQAFNYKTDGATYETLDVQDCEIYGYTKGLLYLNVAATINKATFNNCLIHDIECDGGDFYDSRKGRINETNLTNSTIYNVALEREFIRIDDASGAMGGGNPVINILNCTLNNVSNFAGKRLLYVRYAGNVINWKNNLTTNTAGVFSNQSSTSTPAFENNAYFNTPNLSTVVEKTNNFTDESSSVTWDVDPEYKDAGNGDFTIQNEDVSKRMVGDPRWYTSQE